MYTDLIEVKEIIKQLESTSSSNEKIKIIKKNKDNELFKKVLIYTYDKNLKFKVSKKSIKPRDGKSKWNDLFEMLDELSQSNINNDLKINVNRFLGSIEDEEIRDLVIKILLKDLKCNISVKSINKAIQGLIFDFQVMKASAYNDKTKEGFIKKARKQGYIMSIKRNGERGEVIKENGKIIIKSRQNKLYENLVDLEKAFEDMPDNTFYEGELLAFNPNGEEWKTSEDQFKLTNKILHTDGEKHGIYIELFDMIPLEDFKNGESKIKAKDRRKNIDKLVDKVDNELIHKAETIYQGTNTDLIQEKLEEVSDCSKHEGLMVLLNDSIYESKRVNYHLKVKLWQTMDLKVIGLKESIEKPNTLGSLIVDFKGEKQGVSGISDSLKELWWNNSKEIIGKVIEVKYKSITKDKEGNESLQFCTFVRVREEGKEISYE
ncbi:hypothetical protein [Clostridium sp.]|uniref:ATP-dependent DNA ligase n=1 Tax=Clostridium sp. TaxID=1506 RepID=UPI0025C69CE4|nr:hypothetical protein [Clostridium sp.]